MLRQYNRTPIPGLSPSTAFSGSDEVGNYNRNGITGRRLKMKKLTKLENRLTAALNTLAQKEEKIYIVGGKQCKLVKQGNSWIRQEIK